MIPEEIQSLRDWAAGKMGWRRFTTPLQDFHTGMVTEEPAWVDEHGSHIMFLNDWQNDWQPDHPETGQIWMLVNRMLELGWEMKLGYGDTIQGVLCWVRFTKESYNRYFHDINPCLAILLAARATEEK